MSRLLWTLSSISWAPRGPNVYGELDGLSKWYRSRRGRIADINLNMVYGGWIQLAGRSGRIYTADPLIARTDGTYKPAFTITLD